MRRTSPKSKTLTDENPFSLSLGDLMAGLLLIFVLLLSFLMLNLTEKEERLREKEKRLLEIVETYMKLREDLYLDLKREFEKDVLRNGRRSWIERRHFCSFQRAQSVI